LAANDAFLSTFIQIDLDALLGLQFGPLPETTFVPAVAAFRGPEAPLVTCGFPIRGAEVHRGERMENHRRRSVVLSMALMLTLIGASAFAQGGTSSITGVVEDQGGGVIPGATVVATNNATSGNFQAVSGTDGGFTIPALPVGTYTVSVSLQGFKSAVVPNVVVTAGQPSNVRVKLEVGGVTETVTVEGGSSMIQTQASQASTTIDTNQILNLPVTSRSALTFVQFLPGVATQGSVRDSLVAGLPQSSINITIDGVNIQDNQNKTGDGFFARVAPRLDSMEEVTLTTGAQGAEATGQGSTQIRFTTRSGSNAYSGSLYHFFQSDKLNSNSYSNRVRGLPKGPLRLNQPGGRVGGPIVLPGLYDGRGKAFFFVNYEHEYQPETVTTTSRLLLPDAQQGIFRYNGGPAGGINLFALAAATGVTGTPDPVIARLLQDIRESTGKATGVFRPVEGDPNTEDFAFQQPGTDNNKFPTVRIDYNLSSMHRLSFSMNRTYILVSPDTLNDDERRWPGFPNWGEQDSDRYQWTGTLRSTVGANLINEFRIGGSGGATKFSPRVTEADFTGPLANQMGFFFDYDDILGLDNAGNTRGLQSREPTTRLVENTLTWLKGSHSLSMGASYTQLGIWVQIWDAVPSINFDVLNSDPARAIFDNAANFPGSSSGDRGDARDLYALLVGSVSAINATARLDGATGRYVYNGRNFQEGRLQQFDTFVQDNWRVRPNLSLNVGVRYALQPPFYALNSSYSIATLEDVWGISGVGSSCRFDDPVGSGCNIFKAGTESGRLPSYSNLSANTRIHDTDWNNIAPSIGVNWTPRFGDSGILRAIFGDVNDTSFSGGFSRAYERHGMGDYTGRLDNNPGLNLTANRTEGNGNLGAVPLLLRNGNLGAPPLCSEVDNAGGCMLDAPTYPLFNTNVTGSVDMFDPKLRVSYADSYTAAIQRQVGRNSSIEIRYLGTRSHDLWERLNYNEANVVENDFAEEFENARRNLQASIAAGCSGSTGANACTFAYRGPGTNTVPLPIYLAYFSGVPQGQAGDPAQYSSSLWRSSNFINPLGAYNANIFTPAGTNSNSGLAGSPARQANAIAAGLPANFFRANPHMLGGAFVTTNGGFTRYNSVQFNFRRRLSGGLQFDANYTFGKGLDDVRYSFRVPRVLLRETDDVTHALKSSWVLEVPVGRGKRFGTDMNRALDYLVGGWVWSGTTRIQSGDLFNLGNVRIVGMTRDDVQKMFTLRKIDDEIVYSWPQDVIDETIKAFSTSATSPTGYGSLGPPSGRYFAPASTPDCFETVSNSYGDCGNRELILTGPIRFQQDWSLRKRIPLGGRSIFEVSVDIFNVFNHTQWGGDLGLSSNLNNWRSGLPGSSRRMQIGTRVSW
jgi:hypothetical protein